MFLIFWLLLGKFIMAKHACVTRENTENSKHPELEPPCTLIYIYMKHDDMIKEFRRSRMHLEKHNDEVMEHNEYNR